jgi:hypothetical protein
VTEVASYGLRQRLRSRGLLAAALLLAFVAVAVVDGIVTPVEALQGNLPAPRGDAELTAAVAGSPHLAGLVTWVTGADSLQMAYLLEQRPALLSGVWIVLLALAPFLVAVSVFDQTASDIGSRWLRFAVFRARRTSVFAGRLLESALTLLLLYALLCGAVVTYLDLRVGLYPRGDLWSWGVSGFLALAALVLPYAALCALASAASRTAVRALGLCAAATVVPIVVLGLLAASFESAAWLELLQPWGWKLRLLHPEPAARALAFGALAAFTAAFGAAGGVLFARRDL